jgi:hypothetical protein
MGKGRDKKKRAAAKAGEVRGPAGIYLLCKTLY